MFKGLNWKILVILVIAATIGLIAIIPYSLTLQGPDAAARAQAASGMPLPLLLTVQIASQAVLFAVAAAIGLSFAGSIGLGLPVLEAKMRGEPVWDKVRAYLPLSILLGVGAALIIIGLDVFVFQPLLKAELGAAAATATAGAAAGSKPPAWMGFLASFYGGIDEEILLRLCVMSFLAWVGHLVSKTAEGKPTLAVLWTANVLAAVLFGIGHLPATATYMAITPLVVVRAIVLNGLAGVAFGYLYFKHGLESAMISHFSADIVLHVLFAI